MVCLKRYGQSFNRTGLSQFLEVIVYKFQFTVLEVLVYMVARIQKDNRPLYIKCEEWEPRPEIPYQLLHVIEIKRVADNGLKYWFETRDSEGIIDPLDWEEKKWWKFSSPKGLTLRVALDEKTNEVFWITLRKQENGKYVLDVEHEAEDLEERPKEKIRTAPQPVIHVEIIKPRKKEDRKDNEDRVSHAYRRGKALLKGDGDGDDPKQDSQHDDNRTPTEDEATPEEINAVLSRENQLSQRIDLTTVS